MKERGSMSLTISFTKDEMTDLIYAAQDAMIRFKRARTELRKGNESYQQWDEETLLERITHYSNLRDNLKAKAIDYYGDW